jgi:hypothetical protein
MAGMLAATDAALLDLEFVGGVCPVCHGDEHQHGCVLDQALSERGWCTRADRDAARSRLLAASAPTLPPPPSTSGA